MAAATTEGMGNCKIVKFYAIKILAVKMGACWPQSVEENYDVKIAHKI